jgi:hypothetical protein
MKTVFVSLVTLAALAACSSSPDPHVGASSNDSLPGDDGVTADQVEVVHGVPDRGRDPAVVALEIDGDALCTATLVAPDVVLTARHCVARTSEQVDCPAASPQVGANHMPSSLHVLVGDDADTAREVARGKEIIAPNGWSLCDADIALVVLDRAVPGISPLPVRRAGIATGDHVRAIGYGRVGDGAPAGVKLLRDHVRVVETGDFEFVVGEATCQGDSGGPAIDESSGEIVGVVSRGGPACDGSNVHNVYTRADVYLPLIEEALRRSGSGDDRDPSQDDPGPDAGVHSIADAGHHAKDAGAKDQKPVTDMGGACHSGSDCSTGVCVREHGRQYCSRECGAHDRCPTHYGCTKATSGAMVCVAK